MFHEANTHSLAAVDAELSPYAEAQQTALLEAIQLLHEGSPPEECPRDILDALEGIARTFPFDGATQEAAQSLDGLVDHAVLFDGAELTVRGMAYTLPNSQQPFVITVRIDLERAIVQRVDVSLGEHGCDPSAHYTSRELRYLEDALRNDVSRLNWAHSATWTTA